MVQMNMLIEVGMFLVSFMILFARDVKEKALEMLLLRSVSWNG
jgi:hypothetical protein